GKGSRFLPYCRASEISLAFPPGRPLCDPPASESVVGKQEHRSAHPKTRASGHVLRRNGSTSRIADRSTLYNLEGAYCVAPFLEMGPARITMRTCILDRIRGSQSAGSVALRLAQRRAGTLRILATRSFHPKTTAVRRDSS